jgi:hypothetical protein
VLRNLTSKHKQAENEQHHQYKTETKIQPQKETYFCFCCCLYTQPVEEILFLYLFFEFDSVWFFDLIVLKLLS